MGLFFYNLFISLYFAGVSIASIFNKKARKWKEGRKTFPTFQPGNKTIWMHCASLGEFEQGRPLLEICKKEYPNYRIVVTFFSPSGYEIRKDFNGADAVMYLPLDGYSNATRFIDMIDPALVIWIKYEYWYYYLKVLHQKNIPVLLVSGIFRESQPFFKWYGSIWRQMLRYFSHLFVQNRTSIELLPASLKNKITLNGDTRFDRVITIAEQETQLSQIEKFCGSKQVLIAGSTWLEDEIGLVHYVNIHPEIRFIIAPHEIDTDNLNDLKKEFKKSILYSQLEENEERSSANVLIIDNIGMLSKLYKYATVTYVGGGFNASGIHNILEAVVYGKPVVFGPVYKKFQEARELVNTGAAFSISNAPELERTLDSLFNDKEKLQKAGTTARDFVYDNRGATARIMDYIAANRLLIS